MGTPTYTPIASQTLAVAAASVTFSSIPQTFRDLVLIANVKGEVSNVQGRIRFNNNTTGIYNTVIMRQTSNQITSEFFSTNSSGILSRTSATSSLTLQISAHIMDYSATDKHKTALVTAGGGNNGIDQSIIRFDNALAITSLTVLPDTAQWAAGATFQIYGVIS